MKTTAHRSVYVSEYVNIHPWGLAHPQLKLSHDIVSFIYWELSTAQMTVMKPSPCSQPHDTFEELQKKKIHYQEIKISTQSVLSLWPKGKEDLGGFIKCSLSSGNLRGFSLAWCNRKKIFWDLCLFRDASCGNFISNNQGFISSEQGFSKVVFFVYLFQYQQWKHINSLD